MLDMIDRRFRDFGRIFEVFSAGYLPILGWTPYELLYIHDNNGRTVGLLYEVTVRGWNFPHEHILDEFVADFSTETNEEWYKLSPNFEGADNRSDNDHKYWSQFPIALREMFFALNPTHGCLRRLINDCYATNFGWAAKILYSEPYDFETTLNKMEQALLKDAGTNDEEANVRQILIDDISELKSQDDGYDLLHLSDEEIEFVIIMHKLVLEGILSISVKLPYNKSTKYF
ncbi:MAG: hypothetical protein ACMG6E_03965 [Candidatus Roizmanbacteria bacterium]